MINGKRRYTTSGISINAGGLSFFREIHLTEEGDGLIEEDRAPHAWKH